MDTFEGWYRQLHPRLHAAMRITCGSAADADEVVAEAFGRAAARWARVEQMANPDGWAYTVALHLARDLAARRTREDQLARRSSAPGVHADELGAATQRFVEMVAPLPPRMREVLVLRHVADLTEPGIAEVLGVSRGTVSSTLRDAHRRVERQLAEESTPAAQPEEQDR
jgi:RNA polymerase sigma-70 factor (ECF subfamily)